MHNLIKVIFLNADRLQIDVKYPACIFLHSKKEARILLVGNMIVIMSYIFYIFEVIKIIIQSRNQYLYII